LARLTIEPIDGTPRFVVRGVARSGRAIPFHQDVAVQTRRRDGGRQEFAFAARDGALVATEPVPAPHGFVATLRILHDDHAHEFPVTFGTPGEATDTVADGPLDPHGRAHAEALRRRLAGGAALTRWQIVLFGLSGGLLPCPAAVTVLLLCLRLQRLGLGLLLVGAFSLGLALTMIAAGAAAALGTRHFSSRFAGLAALSGPATYASCALILAIGLYMLVQGIDSLA
jgi:nickel/cobalt exporter